MRSWCVAVDRATEIPRGASAVAESGAVRLMVYGGLKSTAHAHTRPKGHHGTDSRMIGRRAMLAASAGAVVRPAAAALPVPQGNQIAFGYDPA